MADCERALIKPINFVEAFVDLHRRLINSTDLAEDFFGDADAVQRLDLKADEIPEFRIRLIDQKYSNVWQTDQQELINGWSADSSIQPKGILSGKLKHQEQTDIEMAGKKERQRREEIRGKRRPRGRVRRPGEMGGRDGGRDSSRDSGRDGGRDGGPDRRGPSGPRLDRRPSSGGDRPKGRPDGRRPNDMQRRPEGRSDQKNTGDSGRRPEKAPASKPAVEKKDAPKPNDEGK